MTTGKIIGKIIGINTEFKITTIPGSNDIYIDLKLMCLDQM